MLCFMLLVSSSQLDPRCNELKNHRHSSSLVHTVDKQIFSYFYFVKVKDVEYFVVCFYSFEQRGDALEIGDVSLLNFEIWCTHFSYIMR